MNSTATINPRDYRWPLAFLLVAKLLLAAFFPLTGDEAYFMQWAESLAPGYYDHPPLIGWVLWGVGQFSDSVFAYRLVAYVIGIATALVLYHVARPLGKDAALLAAALFVASPMHMLQFLVTNDSVLLLTCGLTVLSFQRALRYGLGHWKWPILGGIALGLAVLSKYFVLFLYLSLLIVAFMRRKDGGLRHLFVMSLVAVPFGLQHLYYNLTNCWNNIAFNLLARSDGNSGLQWDAMGEYIGLLVYVLMPWTVWYLIRQRQRWWRYELMLPIAVGLVPLWLFLVVSLKREVGLHWLLAFAPFAYTLVTALTDTAQRRILKLSIGFGGLHALLLLAISAIPASVLVQHEKHGDYAMFIQQDKLCAELAPWKDESLFAGGYTMSAMVAQLCDLPVNSLFSTSKYGRLADTRVDLREYDQQRLVYVDKGSIDASRYAPYFSTVEVKELDIGGATLSVMIGEGFNYMAYRENYLRRIDELFYQRPDWLPPAACPFTERYFPPEA
ncbi:MAG: glycosyltransferase family 39 protein [Gammaproteobacteria bacterium]|nr:glycosyltransferase family 39 protein [Gammaproteobacteria bacterium]